MFNDPQETELIIAALKTVPPVCALLKIVADGVFKKQPPENKKDEDQRNEPKKPAPKLPTVAPDSVEHE